MGASNSKFSRHEHPLALRNEHKPKQANLCELCTKPVIAPFYACDSCKYYVHKSCGDLPLQITSSFHPPHPLYLYRNVFDWCDSCNKDFKVSPFYKCEECDVSLDVRCATLPEVGPSSGGPERVQHSSHPHFLTLVAAEHVGEKCAACKADISSGSPAFGCSHCEFYLHESCAELPIPRHPLHPRHNRLSLVDCRKYVCGVCEKVKQGKRNFNFKCDECKFRLCRECRSVRRCIDVEDHEHTLCFVENTGCNDLDRCNGYEAYCKRSPIFNSSKEFELTKSSILKCLDCDFKLHLLCSPLPSTIKHECHIHTLTLLDSLIEDDYEEFYCDVCETKRDPRIRLYHCKDCKYIAHVHCVISEISKVLKGELESIELKALGSDTWIRATIDEQGDQSTSLTLKDLIAQLHVTERQILEIYYEWDHELDEVPTKQRERFLSDEEINGAIQFSRFGDREFMKFCNDLVTYSKFELESSDLGLKLVRVKGYFIPHSLANVLATLLNEHGDGIINIKYPTSLERKSFVLFSICQTVKKMHATVVKDITKNLLREWLFHLRYVVSEGFKIDFALVQFECLVDAFFGLQAQRLEHEIPKALNAKIAQMQQRIAEMENSLKKCKEYQGSSEKSDYMKHCLKKASKSQWLSAFDIHNRGKQSIPRFQWKREHDCMLKQQKH